MKILHIASFRGNIGDNANHNGLRSILTSIIGKDLEFDEIEMRRFYQNYDGTDPMRFDHNFAKLANNYDLVIIGGGNFFEVWIESSSTGCTIDILPEVIDVLQTKVLFFGMGFDRYKGFSANTLAKFFRFIAGLQDRNRFLVTVRNDGSFEQFVDSFGAESGCMITKVPDGGFFINIPDSTSNYLKPRSVNIVLSLAMDMPRFRYGTEETDLKHDILVDSIVNYIKSMCSKSDEYHFVLMPHIYSDLRIDYEVLDGLPDYIRRNRISVGPCLSGMGNEKYIFSNYRDADLIVGMRFHANVCGIGMETPTLGVSTYKKIEDLYREAGFIHNMVEGRSIDLGEQLTSKSISILKDGSAIRDSYRQLVARYRTDIEKVLRSFLLS